MIIELNADAHLEIMHTHWKNTATGPQYPSHF